MRLVDSGKKSISIHALRVEGDPALQHIASRGGISIHALRVEGDASAAVALCPLGLFLSTPSGWRATVGV